MPILAPKKAVRQPITTRLERAIRCAFSKIGASRIRIIGPEMTNVQACKRLDTGVGPSIAATSQLSRKICADFAITANVKTILISVIELNSLSHNT